jgi:exodeoxyribonuclease VII large subunit
MQVDSLRGRLVDPKKKLIDHRLKLDEVAGRLARSMMNQIRLRRERLDWRCDKLSYNNPKFYITKLNEKLDIKIALLQQSIRSCISERQARLREATAKLDSLNPTAILARGFSITRTLPETTIVRDSASVSLGQALEIVLGRGSLTCEVKEKFKNGQKIV